MADEPETGVQHWLDQISAYEREFKKWESLTDKILKKYRDDQRNSGSSQTRFNILWSNVQTIIPAVYSKTPKADVSRRFTDNDPVGRVASLILERALDFEIEHYPDFTASMRSSVQDRFLGGRGTAWVRYEPHTKDAPDVEISEDIEPKNEQLDYECSPSDYVHWRDFGHTIARTWEEVPTVWRKVYMDRPALVERFGEKLGHEIPLDSSPEDIRKGNLSKSNDLVSQALIIEIWDKPSSKAIWISKSLGKIVDERDDPLKLEGFWPCPRPLYATLTNETLVPVPDFKLYQDQATELDTLADRIDGLINALKVRGVYDASIIELGTLFTEGENNSLIGVNNWTGFAEKNGLKGALDLVDIKPIAEALLIAYQAMEQVKNQVYEITGLSDIIRGQSVASETATAQELKGQYASLRLKALQDDVARYATDILRIKAQVICNLYQPETIMKIAAVAQLTQEDQQLVPQALALLKNHILRNFRIEVAADSLVQMDEDAEKQRATEFLTAVGGFIKSAGEMAMQAPQISPMLMEMLKFGVARFRVGKTLEGVIDQTVDKLKQDAAQPKPTQPTDAQVKAQSDQQIAQQQMQLEGQKHQMQLQADAQTEQAKMQMQAQMDKQKAEQDIQLEVTKHQMQLEADSKTEAAKLDFERWKAQLEAETAITVAGIAAKAQMQKAEQAAEAGVEKDLK